MQLRSDITGKLVYGVRHNVDASCIGAAILAGIGAGIFKDPSDVHTRLKQSYNRFVPTITNEYQEQKAAYLMLHCHGLME